MKELRRIDPGVGVREETDGEETIEIKVAHRLDSQLRKHFLSLCRAGKIIFIPLPVC